MAPTSPPTTFAELIALFIAIINQIIPVLIGLAFLFIVWKLIDAWIIHADDPGKLEEGRTVAITGVIVMVIILSIWGILSLLKNSLV